jgi:hypothetical protein
MKRKREKAMSPTTPDSTEYYRKLMDRKPRNNENPRVISAMLPGTKTSAAEREWASRFESSGKTPTPIDPIPAAINSPNPEV